MKVRVSEASGVVLDWLVAKCEGLPLRLDPMGFSKDAPTSTQAGWWAWDGEGQNQVIGHSKTKRDEEDGYSPSTDWAQGGPIIKREGISWHCGNKTSWHAYAYGIADNFSGPTPLIAAMRSYVASKLGEIVEVPDALN